MRKAMKDNAIASLSINIIILLIYFLFFNIVLETNDEFAFSAFLSGAYGGVSSHLVFSNVFLGVLLEILYSLNLGRNWYSILQIIFNFLSLNIICFVLLMKTEVLKKRMVRYAIAFSVLLVIGFQHFYLMQWTKSAYLIILAGLLLFLYALHEYKGNIFILTFSGMLILIGTFIRFDTLYVVLAFFFVRCIYDMVLEQKFCLSKQFFCLNAKYIASFLVLLCILFGFKIADGLVYKYGTANEEWKLYREYNVLRSELVDYGIPSYEEHIKEYEKIGLTETDIQMLNNWTFSDPEVFTTETFEKIISLKEKRNLNGDIVYSVIENIICTMKSPIGIITVIITFLYLLNGKKKQCILFTLYTFMMFLLYGYLTYMDRVIFRCEYGIWFTLLTLLLYDFSGNISKYKRIITKITALIMALIILLFSVINYHSNYQTYTRPLEARYRELFNYTSLRKENLYMRDVSTLSNWHLGFSPLEALPYGYLSNIYLLGGWEIRNPITDVEKEYGLTNPWRQCVDSDNIFIIDNVGIELKLKYIRQRYCKTAEAIQVDEVAGFKIYKIVSCI